MRTENLDVICEKCIRDDDDGNLSLDDALKELAWKQHYKRLLNIEYFKIFHVLILLLVQHSS